MESERIARLPKTPLVLDDATYDLCGDFAALVEAESFFNLRGHRVNLAAAIWNAHTDPTSALDGMRELFPCAVHTFHQRLDFVAAQEMLSLSFIRPIIRAIEKMWPAVTEETEAANENLVFDLDELADANEFFGGKAGLGVICVEGPFTLDYVCRVFPCAVHRFRPELNLSQARQLMTIQSVCLVIGGLGLAWQAASQESQDRFAERLCAVASDEERQEVLFRVLAKKPWPGAAHA